MRRLLADVLWLLAGFAVVVGAFFGLLLGIPAAWHLIWAA